MKLPSFELERIQSLYENSVYVNLTESGIEPLSLKELMNDDELDKLVNLPLGYGYTKGSPLLRQRISNLYTNYSEENILVTSGSAEAIFLSALLTVSEGDRVVMMTPNYLSFNGIAESLGAKVDYIPLKKEEKWRWDLDFLEKSISSKTKIISICNPNNPTGSILTLKERNKVIELAKSVDAFIHSDEVYIGSELKKEDTLSFQDIYDKTIITSGLSKSYSNPGIRIGWIAAQEELIEKSWGLKDYTTIASSNLSQHIAEKILEPKTISTLRSRNKKILNQNLQAFSKWALPYSNIFSFIDPEAGGFVFVEYNIEINSTELIHDLRINEGVFIVPGDSFGMDKFFRIGLGSKEKEFTKGLVLLSRGLSRMFPDKFA